MRERLTLQTPTAQAWSVSSLTRVGTTATVTTPVDHGYASNDYVTLAGASPSGYNGKFKVTVTGARTFTFTCGGSLTTPATGAITATYASDAQGGRRVAWTTIERDVPAEMIPISASERLQRAAVQSDVFYRFRIRLRDDLDPKDRALWTPEWPPSATERELEIAGILPYEDGRTYQLLECSESPRR